MRAREQEGEPTRDCERKVREHDSKRAMEQDRKSVKEQERG